MKSQLIKKMGLGLAVACAALVTNAAGDGKWMTDLSAAQKKAKDEKKLVLMDFTGSDWCVWCKKLNKEVFSTKEFTDYAKDNLVLVEVDFPRTKQLSKEQKNANQALQEKYAVGGFPTVIVLDGEGTQVWKGGYMPGGPKPFLAELSKAKKK